MHLAQLAQTLQGSNRGLFLQFDGLYIHVFPLAPEIWTFKEREFNLKQGSC